MPYLAESRSKLVEILRCLGSGGNSRCYSVSPSAFCDRYGPEQLSFDSFETLKILGSAVHLYDGCRGR